MALEKADIIMVLQQSSDGELVGVGVKRERAFGYGIIRHDSLKVGLPREGGSF